MKSILTVDGVMVAAHPAGKTQALWGVIFD